MGFWSDVGNGISSGASAVGNALENGADAVVDTVEDVVDTFVDGTQDLVDDTVDAVCDNTGDTICGAASVVGGLINGGLEAAQDLTHDALDTFTDVVHIVSDILRGDIGGAIAGLGGLLLDIVSIAVDATRFAFGGYFVGGIIDQFKRKSLREFVSKLLEEKFSGERLRRAKEKVGLDGGEFGFPMDAYHLRFYLDSANTPLWQWHEDGFINLYALAGLHFTFEFSPNARTVVKRVGDDGTDAILQINRWQLSNYINSKGTEGRIRVYSMSDEAIAQKVQTAIEKCKQLAVKLSWNVKGRFSWFSDYSHGNWEIKTKEEYKFPLQENTATGDLGLERYLIASNLRTGNSTEDCELVALAAFRFKKDNGKEKFGLVASRNPVHNPKQCSTPNRSDRCCNEIKHRNDNNDLQGGGVIHRDVWPYDVMQYVLVHEIGHYLGLCHIGHNPSDIMYTIAENADTEFWDWGDLSYYWDDEPHFTLEDAKNTWRFIVDQMQHCL